MQAHAKLTLPAGNRKLAIRYSTQARSSLAERWHALLDALRPSAPLWEIRLDLNREEKRALKEIKRRLSLIDEAFAGIAADPTKEIAPPSANSFDAQRIRQWTERGAR